MALKPHSVPSGNEHGENQSCGLIEEPDISADASGKPPGCKDCESSAGFVVLV